MSRIISLAQYTNGPFSSRNRPKINHAQAANVALYILSLPNPNSLFVQFQQPQQLLLLSNLRIQISWWVTHCALFSRFIFIKAILYSFRFLLGVDVLIPLSVACVFDFVWFRLHRRRRRRRRLHHRPPSPLNLEEESRRRRYAS